MVERFVICCLIDAIVILIYWRVLKRATAKSIFHIQNIEKNISEDIKKQQERFKLL